MRQSHLQRDLDSWKGSGPGSQMSSLWLPKEQNCVSVFLWLSNGSSTFLSSRSMTSITEFLDFHPLVRIVLVSACLVALRTFNRSWTSVVTPPKVHCQRRSKEDRKLDKKYKQEAIDKAIQRRESQLQQKRTKAPAKVSRQIRRVKTKDQYSFLICKPVKKDQTGFAGKQYSVGPKTSLPVELTSAPLVVGCGDVFAQGYTRYYHIPHLPHAAQIKAMLLRLAHEFEPLLQRRGYKVLSVSEWCCCCDGLDYGELGGQHKRLAKGRRINGIDQNGCGGYNQTMYGNRGKFVHRIHLRLRSPKNHWAVYPYSKIRRTMCHELAHCVHHNHSNAFYQAMDEIEQEVDGKYTDYDVIDGGFNIYGSSMGRLRGF